MSVKTNTGIILTGHLPHRSQPMNYSHPLDREPELVLDDFLDELLPLKQARDIYGVVSDAREPDEPATGALRARLPQERSDR